MYSKEIQSHAVVLDIKGLQKQERRMACMAQGRIGFGAICLQDAITQIMHKLIFIQGVG
jgi:hypothetical protein